MGSPVLNRGDDIRLSEFAPSGFVTVRLRPLRLLRRSGQAHDAARVKGEFTAIFDPSRGAQTPSERSTA